MEAISILSILFFIVTIGVEIFLIVKFIGLCNDVNAIKSYISGVSSSSGNPISIREVKEAMLTGREEQIYLAILERLLAVMKEYDLHPNGKQKIEAAERMCAILGRELPEQLRSIEAYRQYMQN